MESSPVVIVGAGPAGLALGLSLAKFEIKSVILEKESEITDDPRGVWLDGDTVRILCDIGVKQDRLDWIGHQVNDVYFHKTNFANHRFLEVGTTEDGLHQTIYNGMLQIQPRLERVLHDLVAESPYCEIRIGAEVSEREVLQDGIVVGYKDRTAQLKHIKASYLIGADGKKGVVRKYFLEKEANIKQEVGLMTYTDIWIAANLHLKLPTPETHPDFALWKLGYTPQKVYDTFFPPGVHFCSPPGVPVACMRFGPHEERLWRHEFAVPNWNDSMDSHEMLDENLTPMLTRSADATGTPWSVGPVTFPKDCIEIRRCRPYLFHAKVVNQWFHDRTILIGDAAHVFPPFGGQGIACGLRDAHSLAWRLATMLRLPAMNRSRSDAMLSVWQKERRQGVDDSTVLTLHRGTLTTEPETWGFYFARNILSVWTKFFKGPDDIVLVHNRAGVSTTKGGFYLPNYRGGNKMAQIRVATDRQPSILSDHFYRKGDTAFTLMVLDKNGSKDAEKIKEIITRVDLSPCVISEKSITYFSPETYDPSKTSQSENEKLGSQVYYPVPKKVLEEGSYVPGYDSNFFMERVGYSTKYAIVRPDFMIFSRANTLKDLEQCLIGLKSMIP